MTRITVDDNYFIEIEASCYTARYNTHRKNKENNDIINDLGYYPNVKSALTSILKHKAEDEVESKEEVTLSEYIKIITAINNELKKILDKIPDKVV